MSLATRGTGFVGQVSKLITQAFDEVAEEASKVKGSNGESRAAFILLIDEADALAQSRENVQMHHEDRAGVNALIQGIDRFMTLRLPIAVLLCTNRLAAIDPAVRRRAAEVFEFLRPDEAQRKELLRHLLGACGFSEADLANLAQATGSAPKREYGFTHSDLSQRLIPALVMESFPSGPMTIEKALSIAKRMIPTPPFNEGA